MLIALILRFVAVAVAALVVLAVLFVSGRIPINPERPGRGRRLAIDWGCPGCAAWGVAYVSRFWRERARRHAIGLAHARMSPQCPCRERELLIV